jgi:hypothetical protein
MPEEIEETETGKAENIENSAGGANFLSLTTPEGMVMMSAAAIIDILGFFGFPWLFIPDIFFGFWLMVRGSFQSTEEASKRTAQAPEKPNLSQPDAKPKVPKSAPPVPSGTAKTAAKTAKKSRWIKWLRPIAFIGEMIPVISALPLWTILVYSELLYNS